MAKKRKPSSFNFSTFFNDLTAERPKKTIEEQEERQYFLIVTEGTRTEPNYFNELTALLPPQLVNIKVEGQGKNTLDVVRAALKLRDKRQENSLKPNYDEVWVVFDLDEFPPEHFNKAIEQAEKESIKVAYSNEAFELWYVLHFQLLETAVSRKQYQNILKKHLGNYTKNGTNMYHLLQEKGDEAQAIIWADLLLKQLEKGNPATEKPTTKVHHLVQRLNSFKR